MSTTTDLVKAAGANPDYIVSEADLGTYDSARTAVADKLTTLVKGAGYARTDKPQFIGDRGGNAPLTDPDAVFSKAMRAEKAWKGAIRQGLTDPNAVYKGLSPAFREQFGAFGIQTPQNQMLSQWMGQVSEALSSVGKSITTTSPLSTGLVPYNLVAPSRLIYPVYSPLS